MTTFAALGFGLTGVSAQPDMVLTSGAVAQGLSLSTFATGFPSGGGVGPL
ncbi:MAG: hypothetical protein M3Y24_00620 [Acidobacteriota bacterium]|nr:hypothetical protein [Acidobacteriota bacterium]